MRLWLKVLLIWLLGCANAWGTESTHSNCQEVQSVDFATRVVRKNGVVIDKANVQIPDKIPKVWQDVVHQLEYRLEIPPCANLTTQRALFISRIGGPYQINIGNQSLAPIRSTDPLPKDVFNGRIGGLFSLPFNNDALVVISFSSLPNVSAGLIDIHVGSLEKLIAGVVEPHFLWQQFHHVIGLILTLTGVLGLLAWWTRKQDQSSLWFGLCCILWAFRGQMLQLLAIPINVLLYEQINYLFMLLSAVLISASTLHSIGRLSSRWRCHLWGTVFISVLGFIVSSSFYPISANLYRSSAFILGGMLLIVTFFHLLRVFNKLRYSNFAWLAAGYVFLFIGMSRDMATNVGLITPTWWTFLTPSFALLLICHFVAGSIYLNRNLRKAENTNLELEARVAQKNAELKSFYDAEQEEKIRSERARLNREIHDGIGAQLMTALRGVERGALSQGQITDSLQEGLDELRLLMDSADIGHDLHGALFAWRNRWEPRLNAVDLSLNWDVAEEISNVKLNQQVILQLIRVLQESVANVVKHAKATTIDVTMQLEGHALALTVQDDGIGITLETLGASHRGLRHMEQRAVQIGASYKIQKLETPQHGTQVSIKLPLQL